MRRARTHSALALCLITGLGLTVRLLPWPGVFTSDGIRFFGSDPWYHVLRSQSMVEAFPAVTWFDPEMNFPQGSEIIWPPLLDQLIATCAWLVAAGDPPEKLVEMIAALVPAVIGALTLPLVWLLGRRLMSAEASLVAAFALALIPAHSSVADVGRPDHHALESFLSAAVILAYLAAGLVRKSTTSETWTARLLLGFGLSLAFWNWSGSTIYVIALAAFTTLLFIACPAVDPLGRNSALTLAVGGISGALLLAGLASLWGSPGALRDLGLHGVSSFHVLILGLAGGFGVGLSLLVHRPHPRLVGTRVRRGLLAAGLALSLALGLCAAAPAVIPPLQAGLQFLTGGSPWYQTIEEFQPLLFTGDQPIQTEILGAAKGFGLGFFLLPLLVVLALWPGPDQQSRRAELGFLGLWATTCLVLTLLSRRFAVYLSTPFALLLGLGWQTVTVRLRGTLRVRRSHLLVHTMGLATLAVVLLPTAWGIRDRMQTTGGVHPDLYPTLQWLKQERPLEKREAVLAGWSFGHHIQYLAKRPVVSNPFGTDASEKAMVDAADFFLARSPVAVEELLARRQVGFILLRNPVSEVYHFQSYSSRLSKPLVELALNWRTGSELLVDREFADLLASRLYFFDGSAAPAAWQSAVPHFRLAYESPTDHHWADVAAKTFKVFEVVPGAELTARTQPATRVEAKLVLYSNRGRVLRWRSSQTADARGEARLNLPYNVGRNGATMVTEPYLVTAGTSAVRISVSETQVRRGSRIVVELGRGRHPETQDRELEGK